MACFIACHKYDVATNIVDLFLQEIVRLHAIQELLYWIEILNSYYTFRGAYGD